MKQEEREGVDIEMEKQNNEFHDLRDALEKSKRTDIVAILEENKQCIPEGNTEVNAIVQMSTAMRSKRFQFCFAVIESFGGRNTVRSTRAV